MPQRRHHPLQKWCFVKVPRLISDDEQALNTSRDHNQRQWYSDDGKKDAEDFAGS